MNKEDKLIRDVQDFKVLKAALPRIKDAVTYRSVERTAGELLSMIKAEAAALDIVKKEDEYE